MLFSPGRGFVRALELSRSNRGGGARRVLIPVLAALGGAFLILMSFKVRGLTGFRPHSANLDYGLFALSMLIGALTGVIAHFLFGVVGAPLVSRLGRRCSPRDLRTIWGLAGFPVAMGFSLLVILDVVIAGREAYAHVEDDALITGWSAGSLALGVSLTIWSVYLLGRGLGVAGGMRSSRLIMVVLLAAVCLVIAAPLAFLVVAGVGTLLGLLVDLVQSVEK